MSGQMTVQVRGDSLVEIVGDILVTLDAANPFNCDTIAAKLLDGLETCGVEVNYDEPQLFNLGPVDEHYVHDLIEGE